jgi:lipopolysaccharide biosynthesis regulator YciM
LRDGRCESSALDRPQPQKAEGILSSRSEGWQKLMIEPPGQQHWQAAAGYVELGMFLEANTELDKIDPFNRAAPEVLAIRLAIYHGLKKWELMHEIAKRLSEFQPDNIQWTISLAYATRRADSIQAAKEILHNAESRFPKEGVIITTLLVTLVRREISMRQKIT